MENYTAFNTAQPLARMQQFKPSGKDIWGITEKRPHLHQEYPGETPARKFNSNTEGINHVVKGANRCTTRDRVQKSFRKNAQKLRKLRQYKIGTNKCI